MTTKVESRQRRLWGEIDDGAKGSAHLEDIEIRREAGHWVAETRSPYLRAEADSRYRAIVALLAASELEQTRMVAFEDDISKYLWYVSLHESLKRRKKRLGFLRSVVARVGRRMEVAATGAATSDSLPPSGEAVRAFATAAREVTGVREIHVRRDPSGMRFVVVSDKPWHEVVEELDPKLAAARIADPRLDYSVVETNWGEPIPTGYGLVDSPS